MACPADEQTAYQIQVAEQLRELDTRRPHLGLRQGRRATPSPACGTPATHSSSREQVVWRVRVWDADGAPSDWSAPARWEMGLLEPERLGRRTLDRVSRSHRDPAAADLRPPVRRRPDSVAKARLYVSGIGAPLGDGQRPGADRRGPRAGLLELPAVGGVPDLRRHRRARRRQSNTVGVQLGNGTAYVRRSVTNPAVGRTAPYSWWQSQLKGSGTLTEDAPAGRDQREGQLHRQLPPRRHDQRRHRGRRRPPRVAGHHQHRHALRRQSPPRTSSPAHPRRSLTGANWIWNVAGASTITPAGPIVPPEDLRGRRSGGARQARSCA